MKQTDIFRITLSCFNMSYSKIGEDSVEVGYCNNYLRAAELFCARTYAWSFLQKRYRFTDTDKLTRDPFDGLCYCYKSPSDIVKVLFINGEHNEDFRIIGNEFYCRYDNPEVTYVSGAVDYNGFPYPDDYGYLIAYRLAVEIAQFIVPDNASVANQIQQKFLLIAQTMQRSEKDMQRKRNPSPRKFVF